MGTDQEYQKLGQEIMALKQRQADIKNAELAVAMASTKAEAKAALVGRTIVDVDVDECCDVVVLILDNGAIIDADEMIINAPTIRGGV